MTEQETQEYLEWRDEQARVREAHAQRWERRIMWLALAVTGFWVGQALIGCGGGEPVPEEPSTTLPVNCASGVCR